MKLWKGKSTFAKKIVLAMLIVVNLVTYGYLIIKYF